MSIKKFFLYILTLLFWGLSTYAVPKGPERGDWNPTLVNKNGTQNAYFITVIELPSVKFLTDKDRNIFIVTNLEINKKTDQKTLLSSEDGFLIIQKLYDHLNSCRYIDYIECEHNDDIVMPYGVTSKEKYTLNKRINKNFYLVDFSKETKHFMLFLMTGKLYNYLTYWGWMDGGMINRPLEFPDEDAYYKVLVPIWPKSPKTNGSN